MRHHTRHAIRTALHTTQAIAHAALSHLHLIRYTLTRAAQHGRTVRIQYVAEDAAATVRDIDPQDVRRSKAGDWYVRAHDHLRDASRSFRLDRITTLETP
ncbi:WYL domain-containing protein [Streptomyces sp. NPDC021098]|uniref:WYL domain-containing protein n=1 Tax=unclassified Streptomyces TaxID=2593676 RepID=UPI0037975CD6